LVTTSICITEIAKRLYLVHDVDKRDIRHFICTLRDAFHLRIKEFDLNNVFVMVKEMGKLDKNFKVDIGEISLLSFMQMGHEVVLVSSDRNALRSFRFSKRCNPRISCYEFDYDEDYRD
jgi:hypothetical protein